MENDDQRRYINFKYDVKLFAILIPLLLIIAGVKEIWRQSRPLKESPCVGYTVISGDSVIWCDETKRLYDHRVHRGYKRYRMRQDSIKRLRK